MFYNQIKTSHLENDLLSEFSCLEGYDIYAGDGHYHVAAVHDPLKGGIDFIQWGKWKNSGGIYFISREKENMTLLKIADLPSA